MDSKRLAEALFDEPGRAFPVRLWDGTELRARTPAPVAGTVWLRDPRAPLLLLPPASERALCEAIIEGQIELEGDAIGLLEAAGRWRGPRPSLSLFREAVAALPEVGKKLFERRAELRRAAMSGARHAKGRDREAVQFHYDLSDDFYRLFLDDQMVYSCACFPSGGESLEAAQRTKLELICRKLDLQRGDRLLDIGCGWGALMAHAAPRAAGSRSA
jgi:cyclopropane-fatty-acyl-phospholipid synthase